MKPEELFKGAWATARKWPENIFKVTEIRDKFVYGITATGSVVGPFLFEEIIPISITQEILEKNGWVVDFKNEFSTRFVWVLKPPKRRIDTTVEILLEDEEQIGVKCLVEIQCSSSNKGINSFHSCDCENIHQLQAAMRLCGIEKNIEL